MMLFTAHPARIIAAEGTEITLPAITAVPLGFIANELITNAAKYGTGRITVSLEPEPEKSSRCRWPTKARHCPMDLTQPPARDWE